MLDPDLQIETIVFQADSVDLTWTEGSEQTDFGAEGHAASLPPAQYEDQITELIEAAQALVDAFKLNKRNPPGTIPGRRR